MKVTITENGPYAVSGGVPLRKEIIGANSAGDSIEWVDGEAIPTGANYALCRCGQSAKKPFCDGSHARVGFDGTETASRQPYLKQAQELDGPAEALTDAESLCAFARFCDREGTVWRNVAEVRSGAALNAFNHQVGQCPSGRLVAWDVAARKAVEPELPASIALVEDPQQGVSGPLWVRGGIEIVAADGTAYETRNRVTLCRCGQSSNKPFCNGAHASVGFKDGL
jgi:CDGSH-type Zn-finger protein